MNDKILDRLRKLIAHEQSARAIGSLAEAAQFAAKIQQLLDTYNLELSDIDIEEARGSVDKEHTRFKVQHDWNRLLLRDIAELNGCRMIVDPPHAMIIGSEIDRAVVQEVFLYFEQLGVDLCQQSLREYKAGLEYRRKRKKTRATMSYKGRFLLGYMIRLTTRLKQQQAENLRAAEQSTALIYIGNKLADADAFASKIKTKTIERKQPGVATFRDPAFFAGVQAGDSVALTSKTLT